MPRYKVVEPGFSVGTSEYPVGTYIVLPEISGRFGIGTGRLKYASEENDDDVYGQEVDAVDVVEPEKMDEVAPGTYQRRDMNPTPTLKTTKKRTVRKRAPLRKPFQTD